MEKFNVLTRCTVTDVPSLSFLMSSTVEKWGSGIGSVCPSFVPGNGDEIVIFEPLKIKKNSTNLHEFCEFMMKNNLFFPNAHGLVVFEKMLLDKKIILLEKEKREEEEKEDWWYIGPDLPQNLHLKHGYGHMVPYLRKNGEHTYNSQPLNSIIEHNERIITFEKKSS